MSLGIIGLPGAGKKTVFQLLTERDAAKAPTRHGLAYGMASVRDPRVDALSAMYRPKKTRYAEFEIALPPDIKPDASRNAQWLEGLRHVDGLLQVVRAFEAPEVFHPEGSVDAARDLDLVQMELLLADLALAETRMERLRKVPGRDMAQERELAALVPVQAHLSRGAALRTLEINDDDRARLASLQFLTIKPWIVVFNTGEDLTAAQAVGAPLAAIVAEQGGVVAWLSAAIECELRELPAADQAEMMQALGLAEPAAHRLSRAMYEALGLISFFTVGPDEVRAWPLRRAATAPEAAGRIHSDLQRGFIRADTVRYDDLMAAGSEKAAREVNAYRLNGKEYRVQDGDVIEIRFSV